MMVLNLNRSSYMLSSHVAVPENLPITDWNKALASDALLAL